MAVPMAKVSIGACSSRQDGRGPVPAVQSHALDCDASLLQGLGQGNHFFHGGFGIVRIDQEHDIVRVSRSKMFKGLRFILVRLDE